MTKKITILILFFSCVNTLYSQNPKVDSLIKIYENTTVDSLRATRMSIIGREMVYSQPEEAFIWLHRSLALAKKSKGGIAASNAYITLADWHYFNGKIDSSYLYTRLAIAHNKKYADKEGLAVAYCSLARYYGDRNEYLKSVEKYEEALSLFENKKSTEFLRMGAYVGIGDTYFRYGAYDAALKAYKDSYTVPNAMNYIEHHANTTNSIGQVHFKLKNYDKAMHYTLRSLPMLKKQGNELGVGISIFNIGEIMFATGKLDSALYYNDKALEIIKNYDYYPAGVADCERLYGDIAMKQKAYSKAEKYYASAANNFAAQGFLDRQTSTMILQAKAFTALGQHGVANELLLKTLDILKQKTSLQELSDCYKALRDNASKTGDFKTAQYYTELYDEAYDNYLGATKIIAAVNSEAKLDLKLKGLQIENRDLIIQRKNRDIGLLIGGLIILALIFVSVIYYLRNKAQIEKAEAIQKIDDLNLSWQEQVIDLKNKSETEIENLRKIQAEKQTQKLPKSIQLNSATLSLDKIYYMEAQDNYTVFYGEKGEIHREVRTLKETVTLISKQSNHFKRVQRSYAVNKSYVEKLTKEKRRTVCLLTNGAKIPISDKYESPI